MYSGQEYSGQDWVPVILKKEPVHINTHKENEPAQRAMSINIQNAIKQARLNIKMSQKDLAQKLNVKVDVIIDYENGKAIPNNQFISKIEKILITKLPRAQKKEKVEL